MILENQVHQHYEYLQNFNLWASFFSNVDTNDKTRPFSISIHLILYLAILDKLLHFFCFFHYTVHALSLPFENGNIYCYCVFIKCLIMGPEILCCDLNKLFTLRLKAHYIS